MRLVVNTLAFTVVTCLYSHAYAGTTEQQQIQELRAELEVLKTAIQKQNNTEVHTTTTPQTQASFPVVANVPKKSEDSALKWKSKNGAEVNIYGFVRADAAYQIEGAKGMFNSINSVALTGEANKKSTEDRLDSTLTTTRIGLDFKAPVQDADIGGKVEIDFRGGSDKDTVRLRHVYMTYNNWLMGQTTSNFLSTETSPEMLDFNTPLGGGTTRTPMVRYTEKVNPNTQYFVALEKGNDENRLPAATAKLSHKFAEGTGLVTARGLLQEVRLRDLGDETELGWGIGLGVNYKPLNQLILNANYSHVSGDNKFLLATADNDRFIRTKESLELIDFDAFTLGVTYKFTPQIRSTLGYGSIIYDENNVKNKKGEPSNDHLQQGWLNVMYNPIKPITFGMEYIYGERETVDNRSGKDNRIEIMAKYDF
ncbi:DcaP-like protein (plasmid) [Acinetobacter sp. LoGeW2-3]|uniref:DcaP family trimeric outer membrane transporter n=1 Tax=Acinetobacter sp. LoGeW2-3 TaxID=1808001 RepID=UPI000C05B3FF|nr:DcaP family trimeric outer membrane transporter [Acinetobacter sp. LoGeW2-3]ATO21106.1 DcaP-like protein [Acinetobacter sp. LoGeW2-3]ATO21218.1 DcaP-like protein [Acinetobacter sp. LoGeW2-3]